MPDAITSDGLTTATQTELITYFSALLRSIYGPDINLDSDSPDGQWMLAGLVQPGLDVRDLITQVNSQFDPDQAIGVILDQRVAINGIQRQGGTFTLTNITLTASQALNLYGLDQTANAPYTVQDAQGNKWILQSSFVVAGAGTYVLSFQAENPGAVISVPNTITLPVTIVLGITSINNPTTYSSLGMAEESDAALRIRRQKSVSLSSQGYLEGLIAALENITGVTFTQVYENTTGSTDGDGIPGHSIWVIVAGTGTAASIANAIYTKRNAGCGMKGTQTYNIAQVDGSNFTIRWDTVTAQDLFIKFTASSLDGVNPPNIAAVRAGLVTSFAPGVYEQVNINDLATAVQAIDNNTLVTSAGFSTSSGGSYTNTLTPNAKNKQFAVSSPDIIILPMILNPTAPSVAHGLTQQFSTLGGYGTLIYSIPTNNSSGSINSSTGLYTAGATHPVTDVVRVTDGLGNVTNVNVSVT